MTDRARIPSGLRWYRMSDSWPFTAIASGDFAAHTIRRYRQEPHAVLANLAGPKDDDLVTLVHGARLYSYMKAEGTAT